ncbi:FAS1-like dehydratase domain-containing protein [Geobacillus zalihae]|uniref:FAS1-like dehydratase domain-containing protein n=1 Tax=Geobacillus zalihae TaxID=213419 RepID=UPI0016800956|nr:MaoC family dehydratase N-terminal domain-containing protein [Geobacillus zalihae]QNU25928.1 MaoC family dehydratase N-terminal domain-containing protein [Geobacillus zalihae]
MKDWKDDWRPMIDAIGRDFSSEVEQWGADEVEKGAIRRFLEPLEFDCPLHYDKDVAKKYGYSDIIAPYSSLLTWVIPPYWKPGVKLFTSAERNAQPSESPLLGFKTDLIPSTAKFYFATDIEIDYIRPIVRGDWLYRFGYILLSCVPKETKVGRGAFTVWESQVRNQDREMVAKVRMGFYFYSPHDS